MNSLELYKQELNDRELSKATKESYLRAIKDLLKYADDREITQTLLIEYKQEMLKKYKTGTVNTKIVIINNYLDFKNKDISVKQERVQQTNVLDDVLSDKEYERLLNYTTKNGTARTRIIMISLYYTGLRVSELKFLTVEALKNRYIDVYNKNKHRRVPIIKPLEKELKKFIKDEGITEGYILRNSRGESLSRTTIFRDLKYIGGQARLPLRKIYPHSFRHLFAKQYLSQPNNTILGLADILGHSSLETTRIYSTLSTDEQRDSISF